MSDEKLTRTQDLPGGKRRLWYREGHKLYDLARERCNFLLSIVGGVDQELIRGISEQMTRQKEISGKQASLVGSIYGKVRGR